MNLFQRYGALRIGPLVLAALLVPWPCAAQNQAKVSGAVKQPDGAPVAGVSVTLESIDGKGATVHAETNKKGRYLIGLVRPGRYRLAVETNDDLVPLRVKGKGIDPNAGRSVLWEVDQDISSGKPPEVNVGSAHQIELDWIVGPPSMTTAARKEAEAKAANDAFTRAHELVRAGDYSAAIDLLVPLTERVSDHAALWYLIGFSRERLGTWADALAAADRAIALDPSFAGAHLLRGRILKGLGRTDDAVVELRREIAANADPVMVTDAWIALAGILKGQGHSAEAIQALERAVELDPKRRDVLLELAQFYTAAGERAKAAATLERADQAGGTDDVALLNLAIGYMNDAKLEDAKRLATRLIEKGSSDPNLSIAHSVLARCALGGGDAQEGVRQLEKALELDAASRLAPENREILAALKRK